MKRLLIRYLDPEKCDSKMAKNFHRLFIPHYAPRIVQSFLVVLDSFSRKEYLPEFIVSQAIDFIDIA